MTRVSVVALFALALLAAPLAVEAKTSSIGLLCSVSCTQSTRDAFIQGLQEHGHVLGRNLVIDERREVDQERAFDTARDLVAGKPDVLVGLDVVAAGALARQTRQVPVVAGIRDPMGGMLSLLLIPSSLSALNFRPASSRMASMLTLILTGLLFALRTRRALALENLALRHQLAVLQRAAPHPRLRRSDRLLWVLLSRLWNGWADALLLFKPETVIRWHRAGFARCWTWKSRRIGPGRPAVAPDVRALIHGCPRPTPCGVHPGFTGNSGSWASRFPRRQSPSTWSAIGHRHRRPGAPS
jgi:hypothetical protein